MTRFCNQCGATTHFEVPKGDTLPRHICYSCRHIQYENPRVIAGCIGEFDGKILLCRRAIEPRVGYWTLPAGFMENGETTKDAARRETQEEAGIDIAISAAFALINIASINQVHIFYRGELPDESYHGGTESLEVALFEEDQIPWDALAFRSVEVCLQKYIADRKCGAFGFHELALEPNPSI